MVVVWSRYVLPHARMCCCSHHLNSSPRPEDLETQRPRSTSMLEAAALPRSLEQASVAALPRSPGHLLAQPYSLLARQQTPPTQSRNRSALRIATPVL